MGVLLILDAIFIKILRINAGKLEEIILECYDHFKNKFAGISKPMFN